MKKNVTKKEFEAVGPHRIVVAEIVPQTGRVVTLNDAKKLGLPVVGLRSGRRQSFRFFGGTDAREKAAAWLESLKAAKLSKSYRVILGTEAQFSRAAVVDGVIVVRYTSKQLAAAVTL